MVKYKICYANAKGGIYIFDIFLKYKEKILYVFFGGVTTIVNIVTYSLLTRMVHINNMVSNVLAWIITVLVAYITNKLYVFCSKSLNLMVVLRELTSFLVCRLVTLVIDMVIMYIFINILKINDIITKVISNVVVIIANYIFSKLVIFKKEDRRSEV